jgi:quercetin dioxygenase-like cupin family protein
MRIPPIGRWLAPLLLAAAILLLPPSGPAATLAAPVSDPASGAALALPADSSAAWFDVEQPPTTPFEAVQMIVDFPPGTRVARHTHGGPGYITMLTGTLTMSIGDAPVAEYKAGQSFVEPFKVIAEGIAEGANLYGDPASVLVTYLLPVGAAVTTPVQAAGAAPAPAAAPSSGSLPPGAVPRFESRLRLESMPAGYRVGQMLQTYAPGDWSMSAIATAPRLLTVVSGEVHVLTGATDTVYTPGKSWSETPGTAYLTGNQSASEAAVVAVSVIEAPR